jgi:hypothetical protein
MNKEALIKQIRKKAQEDKKKRRDRRFIDTMGFLLAKGFLRANFEILLLPNKRLRIDDAIWVGRNVEPRILEVLPAAVLRLSKHFDLDPLRHHELARVVDQLRRREAKGDPFCGIPYEKVKLWVEFPLRDKRVKPLTQKKVIKTFRLNPAALKCLKHTAEERKCSETEVLEKLLLG